MNLGRLARTLGRLHPLQIAGRAPRLLAARAFRHVPAAASPRTIEQWPQPPLALLAFALAERVRGARRLALFHDEPRLCAYEANYGLELGPGDEAPLPDWYNPVAVEPYPASVRARRLAVAARCGRRGLSGELGRAARAVLLQPEVHILGNHLLENGLALVCAGAVARPGLESDLWLRAGRHILEWQLPEQFLADGGHIERSASYHLALTAGLLEAIELAEASGRRAPELWHRVARKALGWVDVVRAPDGTYPLFNDAALDAAPCVDDVLALGKAIGVAPDRPESLAATGWVRLDVGEATMIVDAGPDASGWQPGHAHADGLTFELWVRGRRAVVDFGVASYAPGAARDETRATRSHNTVELAGVDSCEVWGAFRMGRRGQGRLVSMNVTGDGSRIDLEHDGYRWLPGRPKIVRSMALSGQSLEVCDRVVGGRGWGVSRVRIDADAPIRVTGTAEVRRIQGTWHPRHGEARSAVVFEQSIRAGDEDGVRWRVDW